MPRRLAASRARWSRSTQVLAELFSAGTRKLGLTAVEVRRRVELYARFVRVAGTERVDGTTLDARVPPGCMTPGELLDLAVQIADAERAARLQD